MTVTIKLGSALNEYRPKHETGSSFSIELSNNDSIQAAISSLGIPEDQGLLVILNGTLIRKDSYPTQLLANGDALSLMPPIHAG